jgi:ATP-dependent metalloprotease
MGNLERVVQILESKPLLHNSLALSQYVKALVSLDGLDESPLLKEVVVSTTNSLRLIDFCAKHLLFVQVNSFILRSGDNPVMLLRIVI